jgi:hypothetical protein
MRFCWDKRKWIVIIKINIRDVKEYYAERTVCGDSANSHWRKINAIRVCLLQDQEDNSIFFLRRLT